MTELILGDCLEKMKDIPDESVDMVLCDLPYGVTACKWDEVIPLEKLWPEYERVVKSNGTIVLFGTEPFASKVRMSNMKGYKYDWIWVKNAPSCFVHAKNKPLAKYENVIVFSKGSMGHKSLLGDKRMTYNPQGIVRINKEMHGGAEKFVNVYGKRPSHKDSYVREYTNYPVNVLYFNKNSKNHPSEKPVPLLEYLIRTYTNPGETVLDNTMGSGSTGVACINTGRSFIGIELDEKYYKIACDRINNNEA